MDLATGLTHATANNKIVLLPGTYNGNLFQITHSGNSPLQDVLITGADGSSQAVISVSGSTQGASVGSGVQYVTLRNLTFVGDLNPGLTFSGAGRGNIVDACRITSNVDALDVVNSSGYQDPIGIYGGHFTMVPGVMLENSLLGPGAGYAGAQVHRFAGGHCSQRHVCRRPIRGPTLPAARLDVTLLDNIFTGQTGACVYFDSNSLMEVNGSYSLVSYFGDGNIYNPAGGGYVATVIDSTSPPTTTARSTPTPNTGTPSNTERGSLDPMATAARELVTAAINVASREPRRSSTQAAAISGWRTSPRTTSIRGPLKSMAGR